MRRAHAGVVKNTSVAVENDTRIIQTLVLSIENFQSLSLLTCFYRVAKVQPNT